LAYNQVMTRCLRILLPLLTLGLLPGCGEGDWFVGQIALPVTAYCSVSVKGKGTKKVETDYLPRVVQCENGGAPTEALKAQAVAARAYMYYKINKYGSIADGTSDQVYSCGKTPTAAHINAVKATAGQILMYQSKFVCAFYVAGAKPSTPTCKALSSDPDSTKTEKYVTYNQGKTLGNVKASPLGWSPGPGKIYAENRGCKSQWGSRCLATKGKKWQDILRFYYGADIKIVKATGSCVNPTPPDAGGPKPDTKPWPKPDSKPWPKPDSKPWPKKDSKPWPKKDSKPWPKKDSRPWPKKDSKPPRRDAGPGPPVYTGSGTLVLEGGCSLGRNGAAWPEGMALISTLLLLIGMRRFVFRARH